MGDVTRLPQADKLDGHTLEANKPAADRYTNLDGFANELTGIGDWTRDKTYGGKQGGPDFLVTLLAGVECENRWRGSDLGGRIVETLPDEMVREGWELTVQPEEEDEILGMEDRADWPDPQPAAPPDPPGMLPEKDESTQAIIEAMDAKLRRLGAVAAVRDALCYERAFGGGAVLLGVDDGDQDLTKPLDLDRVRSVRHLTAFRGGWDGELIAWSWYNDPRSPRYGEPEIYMLRNLGVPIARPPAPGQAPDKYVPQQMPQSPSGSFSFYVHESRLLIFPGVAVSRRARVQMRGWGDSIFTRVNEILSQYGQTWGSVAVLMQEFAQGVLKIDGLAQLMASNDPSDSGQIAKRALMLQMTQSIARVRILDKDEDFLRVMSPLTGVAEVLQQFALRLAAAADMPLSLLMGQVKGGLGDAGSTDIRFFYDRIASRQRDRLLPQLHRLYKILFRAKDGPTQGTVPKRWNIEMRALYQPTEKEQADLRKTVAEADQIYIAQSVLTPEEVAASRFGGSKWSAETVLDLDGRKELSKIQQAKAPPPPGAPQAPAAGGQPQAIVNPEQPPQPAKV